MAINYPVLAAVILVVALLIIFLVRRNRKGEKKFERQIGGSELKPQKHHDTDEHN